MSKKYITDNIKIDGQLLDGSGSAGTSGQVLSSTGSATSWVSGSGLPGGPYLPLSAGSGYPLTGDLFIEGSGTPKIVITDTTNNLEGRIRVANNYMYIDADDSDAVGATRIVLSTDGVGALYLDDNQNATFAGTIAVQGTGDSYFQGNVGIGTTSPTSAKLVISGVPTADYVVDTNGRLKIKGDGTLWWGAAADYGKLTWDTGKAVVRGESGKALSLGANGTQDTIYINTSQNVGIGTTSPTGKLNVNEENGASTVIISRGGTNLTTGTALGNIIFPADYNGTPTDYASINAYANALSSVRGSLDFKVKSTSGNLLTGMTVYGTNAGVNVGIGTTSPSSIGTGITTLDIQGSNAGGVAFGVSGTKNYIYGASTMYVQANTTAAFLTSGSEKMRITSAGNVGIGTTSVAMGLHVADTKGALFGPTTGASMYISPNNENTINGGYGLDTDTGDLWLNYRGYLNGFTRFRDTRIGDGKGNAIVMVDGSSGNVGIGSTNPTNKLRIDAAAGQATTLSNSITNAAVYINSDTANGSNNIRIGESGSGSYFLQASNSSGTTPYAINLNPFGGNVGIGTTSPAYTLEINGNVGVSEYIYHSGDNDTYLRFSADRFRAVVGAINAIDITENGTQDTFVINESGGDVDFRIESDTDTHALFVQGSDGNVGIGTIDADSKLKVELNPSGTVLAGLRVGYNSTSQNFYDADTQYFRNGAGTTERMRIDSSGRVGIGITSPQARLSLGSSQGDGIDFLYDSTNNYKNQIKSYWNSSTDSRIDFNIGRTSGQTPQTIMSVGYGGNVGIGTTSPAEELSVSGDSNITGKLAVGSSAAHPTYDFYNQNTAYFNGAVTVDDTITVNNLTYPEPGAIDASGYNGEIVYFGSQISMSEGKLMVLSTSAAGLTWYQAKDSTSSLATGMLGIALGTAASAGVLVRGIAKNSAWSSFSEGEKLYLSPTSGAISNSITSDTNDFVRIIGYALGGNKIYFCPDNSYVQNS